MLLSPTYRFIPGPSNLRNTKIMEKRGISTVKDLVVLQHYIHRTKRIHYLDSKSAHRKEPTRVQMDYHPEYPK